MTLSLLSTCSWCGEGIHLIGSMTLSLLSTCSWCVVSAYTWLALWLSLLSPVAGVWWEHTLDWLNDSLSSPPVAGVVSAYTWLSLWHSLHTLDWLYDSSLLSTCSWCVVSALASLSCGSRRMLQRRKTPPPPPPMIVKCFGCTTIHNKALYKCIIHSFIHCKQICLFPLTLLNSVCLACLVKEIVHPKMNLMSWITQPRVFQIP